MTEGGVKSQPSGCAVNKCRVIYEFWSNLKYSLSSRIHVLGSFFIFFLMFWKHLEAYSIYKLLEMEEAHTFSRSSSCSVDKMLVTVDLPSGICFDTSGDCELAFSKTTPSAFY